MAVDDTDGEVEGVGVHVALDEGNPDVVCEGEEVEMPPVGAADPVGEKDGVLVPDAVAEADRDKDGVLLLERDIVPETDGVNEGDAEVEGDAPFETDEVGVGVWEGVGRVTPIT